MRTLALALLAATACEEPQPVLELGDGGCSEVVLAVREEVLPGWHVVALAMDQVGGDSGWALARDPDGRAMLQAWPSGPGFDLSGLGPLQAFRLLPGLRPGQSWLTLEREDRLRVWRLGSAAEGVGVEAPDLAAFPGPGQWSRGFMLVDGLPYLLAGPLLETQETITLYVAVLDPETLALGTIWPVDFTPPCVTLPEYGLDVPGCFLDGEGTRVEFLDVTEAGSVAGGGVALLALLLQDQYVDSAMLEVHPGEPPAGPITRRRDGFSLGSSEDTSPPVVRGQIAADAAALYVKGGETDDESSQRGFFVDLRDRGYDYIDERSDYEEWIGPLLQVGARAVIGDFADGRGSLVPVRRGRGESELRADITIDPDARITSAGRGQLLVQPRDGSALRVVAICEASP